VNGTVQVRSHGRVLEYPGAPTPVPGLYVAHTMQGFPIVHVRSGLLIGTYGSPEAALACATDLAPLHDWTGPAPSKETLSPEAIHQLVVICRRWGATKGAYPRTTADLKGGES
jgi:hypothetical protein